MPPSVLPSVASSSAGSLFGMQPDHGEQHASEPPGSSVAERKLARKRPARPASAVNAKSMAHVTLCGCRTNFTAVMDYLEKILNARVYDVAIETPLEPAPILSARSGNRILLQARGHAAGVQLQAARRLQQDRPPDAGAAQARRDLRLGRQPRPGRGAVGAEARHPCRDRDADHHAGRSRSTP
jgi:hypothetical protein